ncbi:unnamed protein product, partial [Rotaria sordida]
VTDPSTVQTTISQSPATTSKLDEMTPPPPPPPNNLGLILGLSLGLGIPLLLFTIA